MNATRDMLLDDERRMLLESVTAFRRENLDDSAREMDETPGSTLVDDAWSRAAAAGLTAALLKDESCGGQCMDAYSFCLALTEVARAQAGFAAMLLSHNLGLMGLEKAGAWSGDMSGLVDGGTRAALAWPFDAREEGGEAPFVPGGTGAGALVFLAPGGEDVFSVAPGDAGVTVAEIERPMGLRASRPARFSYRGEGAAPVGRLGVEGARELEGILLLGIASIAVGIVRQSYERSYDYAKERWQGADLIINHQQMRLMLADMLAGIEAGDAMVRHASTVDPPGLPGCRAARIVACDAAVSAATDGVQIHGGYGYMRDYGMERLMRDAKYCQAYPWAKQSELLELLNEVSP